MTDNALEQAISLIKAGDFDQGGKILISLLKEDLTLEDAWWWLRYCVKTDDQQIYCLKKVLSLNPDHAGAKVGLEALLKRQTPQQPTQSEIVETTTQSDLEQVVKPKKKKKENKKVDEIGDSPKGTDETKKTEISKSERIRVAFIKPKVIFNKPGENPYSTKGMMPTDLPEVEGAMFGTRLTIGGISITPHDYPRCIEAGRTLHKSQCHICEFFSVSDCPIRRDPTILREARTLFVQNKRYRQEKIEQHDAIIETIYNELREHGRPLHYEVLAKIIHDRHPRIKLTAWGIAKIMGNHPGKFEWVDTGVYRAR